MEIFSKIAETQPQAAYSAYMYGVKHKITFFLRTKLDTADYLLSIEEKLRSRFIPTITEGHMFSDTERALLVLQLKFGGLRLQNLCEVANIELLDCKVITRISITFLVITRESYENIITQNKDFHIDIEKTKTIKNKLKTKKKLNY